jgi:hypothetical protein
MARAVARAGYRIIRPVARPIGWRLRSFFIEPLQQQESAQHQRVLAELAALGAKLTRIEALLSARQDGSDVALDGIRESLRALERRSTGRKE